MIDLLLNWWNLVFHDFMGGSAFLMFLFGWEIFLIPIGFVFTLVFSVLNALLGTFKK